MIHRTSGNGKQHCACQCHWDLSWLHFGDSRIAVSDVDGLFVVERNSRFLFLETKGLDEPLTQGQRILMERLSTIPQFTVLVIYGSKGFPEVLRQFRKGVQQEIEFTDRVDFQRRIDDWYCAANAAAMSRARS